MLPRVSRTFALTIRLLSPQLAYTVTVAYLLCRVADTLEDSAELPPPDRAALLARFRACLSDARLDAAPLRDAFGGATHPDRVLAREADIVLREFRRLLPAEQDAIRPGVEEMCTGMAAFVTSLAGRPGQLRALDDVKELERYCYYVAGTVGELLTRLFVLKMPRIRQRRADRLFALSTRFALGLQVTNILQDVAADAERGVGFVPRELVSQSTGGNGAPVAPRAPGPLVKLALDRLNDAMDYSATLPWYQYRMRLFCLAPAYLAVRTLGAVTRHGTNGSSGGKPKISRGEVRRTLAVTVAVAPFNGLLRLYYRLLARKVRLG